MKLARPVQFFATALAALHFTACSDVKITHVAPGKSVAAAIAERGRAKEMPADASAPGAIPVAATKPGQFPAESLPPLPSGEVKIPGGTGAEGGVADAYSRGTFAMQTGQTAEAIAAFEQTVKLDPDFTDAWGKLAILYQKTGSSAKATDAFKRAKRLGDANGGTVSRDAAGGLQLQ
ncbi:MAG: tetratricopeptide repeat protein [Chthoniobacteraceae bacterium]